MAIPFAFTGVPGALPSLLVFGLSLWRIESLDGTLEPEMVSPIMVIWYRPHKPPLPPLFIACPPRAALPETEPGMGDEEVDCVVPTFRI